MKKDAFIPYLAGLIDGEGSIGISYEKTDETIIGFTFRRIITLSGTSDSIVNVFHQVKEKYGGSIQKKRKRKRGWKEENQYVLHDNQAQELLDDIFPYLILKRTQAKLFTSFSNLGHLSKNRYKKTLSKEDKKLIAERIKIYNNLRILNNRGDKTLILLCPRCYSRDFRLNRNKSRFKCLNCNYEDDADVVAGLNISRRAIPPPIEISGSLAR